MVSPASIAVKLKSSPLADPNPIIVFYFVVSISVTWSPLLGLWGFKSGLKVHVLDTKHFNRIVD